MKSFDKYITTTYDIFLKKVRFWFGAIKLQKMTAKILRVAQITISIISSKSCYAYQT